MNVKAYLYDLHLYDYVAQTYRQMTSWHFVHYWRFNMPHCNTKVTFTNNCLLIKTTCCYMSSYMMDKLCTICFIMLTSECFFLLERCSVRKGYYINFIYCEKKAHWPYSLVIWKHIPLFSSWVENCCTYPYRLKCSSD